MVSVFYSKQLRGFNALTGEDLASARTDQPIFGLESMPWDDTPKYQDERKEYLGKPNPKPTDFKVVVGRSHERDYFDDVEEPRNARLDYSAVNGSMSEEEALQLVLKISEEDAKKPSRTWAKPDQFPFDLPLVNFCLLIALYEASEGKLPELQRDIEIIRRKSRNAQEFWDRFRRYLVSDDLKEFLLETNETGVPDFTMLNGPTAAIYSAMSLERIRTDAESLEHLMRMRADELKDAEFTLPFLSWRFPHVDFEVHNVHKEKGKGDAAWRFRGAKSDGSIVIALRFGNKHYSAM